MDNLSKPELLTLLSIMEGELEARDLVIEALRVSPDTAVPSRAATRPSACRSEKEKRDMPLPARFEWKKKRPWDETS